MTREATLGDLENYRLDASFSDTETSQSVRSLAGSQSTRQIWKRTRSLGSGSFGQVWQEALESEHGDWQYRAVKVCSRIQMQRTGVDYRRELSALAGLSSSQV